VRDQGQHRAPSRLSGYREYIGRDWRISYLVNRLPTVKLLGLAPSPAALDTIARLSTRASFDLYLERIFDVSMRDAFERQHLVPVDNSAMAAVFALPSDVGAWGCLGHIIVAQIAADQLTDQARGAVDDLLAGHSLAEVSCWADEVRPARPETRRWHYVDIPRLARSYDPRRDCASTPEGDCLIAAIFRSLSTLKHVTRPQEERAEALRFLVHLLGDLHQPLHCADDHDRGGNEVTVTFLDGHQNLHSVWDTGLVSELVRTDPAVIARLREAARQNRSQAGDHRGVGVGSACRCCGPRIRHAPAGQAAGGRLRGRPTPDGRAGTSSRGGPSRYGDQPRPWTTGCASGASACR
jgi:hypothetical protein